MRINQLSALLVAAALTTASTMAAFAAPVLTTQTSELATAKPLAPSASSETAQYAAREAKDKAVTKFQGGGEVLVIGASSVSILLLVLILVILL